MIYILLCLSVMGCRNASSDTPAQAEAEVSRLTERFREGICPPDSVIEAIVSQARASGDQAVLCHALYLQGSVYHYLCRYDEVIPPLKEAETYIPALSEQDPTAGLIYIVQAAAMEQNDYLWAAAGEKYAAAIPFFIACGDTLRLACCYRDMARMSLWRGDSASYENDFRTAIALAERQPNRLITHDIRMQYLLNHLPADTMAMMAESRILCDSFGLYRYAWIAAEQYLRQNQTDSAAYWLQRFAADTIYTRWSAEKYHQLHSALIRHRGQMKEAYHELSSLYNTTMQRVYVEGNHRTYTIARQYDVEREKQKTLSLQVERQRIYLLMGAIIVVLLIVIVLFLVERSRRLRQIHEAEVAHLQHEETQRQLADKRKTLQRTLKHRADMAVRLQQSANTLPKGMPAWVTNFLKDVSFANENDKQLFMQEFNDAYGDIIPSLQKTYPDLTDQDIYYITLAMLGIDNTGIAIILNSSDRTIWNRRQKIKNRLGDPRLDLDAWIASLPDLAAVGNGGGDGRDH